MWKHPLQPRPPQSVLPYPWDEFSAWQMPIGAKVIFKPSETKGIYLSNMETPSITGVFVGYEFAPGYKWDGTFKIWAFGDFVGIDLSSDARVFGLRLRTPTRFAS